MGRGIAEVDFETKPIVTGSPLPPHPVGLAFLEPGGKPEYWAWGHPSGNNSTEDKGRRKYKELCEKYEIRYHNAPFDYNVGDVHLKARPIRGFHDSQVAAFLQNPHEPTLELKKICETRYGMRNTEQEELFELIREHVPGISKQRKELGEYISDLPGNLVVKYAKGDVVRTKRLGNDAESHIRKTGMDRAYARELKLIPILLKMKQRGVPVARSRIQKDIPTYQKMYDDNELALHRRLKAPLTADFDKRRVLAKYLIDSGAMTRWNSTPSGQVATGMDDLKLSIDDPEVLAMLEKRSGLDYSLNKLMRTWLEYSELTGRLHFDWSGTRVSDAGGERGARTGRLASSPNLQNVPKEAVEGYPNMRGYLVPGKGRVLLVRDYDQQEFRILAYFEEHVLWQAYLDNPFLDMHRFAQKMINEMLGTNFARKPIKNTGFAIIYGAGGGKVAEMTGQDLATGKLLKRSYLKALPGLAGLIKILRDNSDAGKPLWTWGERIYYVEPPHYVKGFWRTFEYKLLNVLVQGSAADCTKEAMIAADEAGLVNVEDHKPGLIFSVHDELGVITEPGRAREDMTTLRSAMEEVDFKELHMVSSGDYSPRSWGDLICARCGQPHHDGDERCSNAKWRQGSRGSIEDLRDWQLAA